MSDQITKSYALHHIKTIFPNSWTNCTCGTDCLTSPALFYNDKFSSNITYEQYSVIDVNINEVNCKLPKYIYLLICTDCGVQ